MARNHGDTSPPETMNAVNVERDLFDSLTDPPTENEVREALKRIGLEHVEDVDVEVAKNKRARFDFDVEQDTALLIARELQEAFDECNAVPIEEIADKIGREIMKRCRRIAALQASRPTVHSVAPVDVAGDSTSAAVDLSIIAGIGDGRESASKSQLDVIPPDSGHAVNFERDLFDSLTDPPTENELREALRGIGLEHVEYVDVEVAKNKRARFDFDVEQDTALLIARELQEAFDECNGVPIEEIADKIGREIMKRCRRIAALQASRPTVHGVTPADVAGDSTSAAVDLSIIAGIGDGRESASKSQLAWATQHPRLSAELYGRLSSGSADSVLAEQVALLQRSLAFLIPSLREDSYERIGAWCEATTAAVASFQAYHKLFGERGMVDDKFWKILSDEHKKKEVKEERRKAQREEERRKAIEELELRRRCRDQESAAQLEAMIGKCKRNLEKS